MLELLWQIVKFAIYKVFEEWLLGGSGWVGMWCWVLEP